MQKSTHQQTPFKVDTLETICNPAYEALCTKRIWCSASVYKQSDGSKRITYFNAAGRKITASTPRPYADGATILNRVTNNSRALAFRVGAVKVVDADDCRNPKMGALEQWALDLVQQFPTYWEISQSGTGLHGYFFADIDSKKARIQYRIADEKHPKAAIEMFLHTWHNIFTGKQLDGTPDTIATLSDEAQALYNKIEGVICVDTPGSLQKPLQEEIDPTILKYIACEQDYGKRFLALWNNSGWEKIVNRHTKRLRYKSPSEAAMGLYSLLYIKCDTDAILAERMFRESRMMETARWDVVSNQTTRETYGGRIMRKVAQNYRPQDVLKARYKNFTYYNTTNTQTPTQAEIEETPDMITDLPREALEDVAIDQYHLLQTYATEQRMRYTPGYAPGFIATLIATLDEFLRGTPEDNGYVRVYQKNIIDRTHQSKQTVINHLNEAERLGLIVRMDKSPSTKYGQNTLYITISEGLRKGMLPEKAG